jgi:polyhydroxybutyrate depolymerase
VPRIYTACRRLVARASIKLALALGLMLVSQCGFALDSATILVGGVERSYVFQIPQNLRRPAPLLLALHGGFGAGRGMAGLSKFATLADEKGFIAVFPDGVGRQWNDGRGEFSETDDMAFLTALIDLFIAKHSADPRRIYATGISNGGMMSYRLACELPKRIAAIGTIAANLPRALAERCSTGPPLPVMIIGGTVDPLMPWAGGEIAGSRGAVLSAMATAQLFALRVGGPVESIEPLPSFANADPTRVKRHRWKTGSGAEVVLYEVEGGGHTWPGGAQYLPEAVIGRTSRQIDASREIVEFLLRFRLPLQP